MLLRCDIFQGRSASVGISLKKLVVGSVTVFIRVATAAAADSRAWTGVTE